MGLEIHHGVRNASRGGHKRRGVCETILVSWQVSRVVAANLGGPLGYAGPGLPPRAIVWAFQS